MRIKHFYYCIFYLLHVRALGKVSFMEASQQPRSMRSSSICSTRTKYTQLTSESHHDDSGQVHYSREKSNNGSSTGNSKYKNLTCNFVTKRDTLDLSVASKEETTRC